MRTKIKIAGLIATAVFVSCFLFDLLLACGYKASMDRLVNERQTRMQESIQQLAHVFPEIAQDSDLQEYVQLYFDSTIDLAQLHETIVDSINHQYYDRKMITEVAVVLGYHHAIMITKLAKFEKIRIDSLSLQIYQERKAYNNHWSVKLLVLQED